MECKYCGNPIPDRKSPGGGVKIYCSEDCRNRANRARIAKEKILQEKIDDKYEGKCIVNRRAKTRAFTILHDPDDAWVEESTLSRDDFQICLIQGLFTPGTLVLENGKRKVVVGSPSPEVGVKPKCRQILRDAI